MVQKENKGIARALTIIIRFPKYKKFSDNNLIVDKAIKHVDLELAGYTDSFTEDCSYCGGYQSSNSYRKLGLCGCRELI